MAVSKPLTIRLNRADNVAVARVDLAAGTEISEEKTTCRDQIPSGHKVAAAVIQAGEAVRKYDQIIGFASRDIQPGEHVHTHNLEIKAFDRNYAIGADRALKRLSRIPVGKHIQAASSVRDNTPLSDLSAHGSEDMYMWVTDEKGSLLGWVETSGITGGEGTAADVMTRLEHRSAAVMNDSTLKEALSRMVQQGIRRAPVVDSKGILQGEIRLEDILEA